MSIVSFDGIGVERVGGTVQIPKARGIRRLLGSIGNTPKEDLVQMFRSKEYNSEQHSPGYLTIAPYLPQFSMIDFFNESVDFFRRQGINPSWNIRLNLAGYRNNFRVTYEEGLKEPRIEVASQIFCTPEGLEELASSLTKHPLIKTLKVARPETEPKQSATIVRNSVEIPVYSIPTKRATIVRDSIEIPVYSAHTKRATIERDGVELQVHHMPFASVTALANCPDVKAYADLSNFLETKNRLLGVEIANQDPGRFCAGISIINSESTNTRIVFPIATSGVTYALTELPKE